MKKGLGKKEIRGLKQTLPNMLSILGRPEDKRYNKFKSSMNHSPIRKYNDKLLARLSKGFDSEPTNIKRKFVDELIKYSLKESINEARLNPKETIKQLGGNRFLYMVGAKNLAIDKPRNELHMKIMRNAKGVSHVVIKLTSLDLYDMKFLSIRAGKIRVKAKEKGVYGDQLATFFTKHTGLNTRL